ncbi:MAG: hypothetical protein C5B47_02270 [Verrucomicrobia bacterium]|nr:MAG: hypothetical protein C5B47_02270 [Verrucomicrobiota bacterium]
MKIFFLLLISSLSAFGELAPSVYEAKQHSASEYLQLRITHVETNAVPSGTEVKILATVTQIIRTSSQIKAAQTLEIHYRITSHPKGWCGPGEIPLLKSEDHTVAYLTKVKGEDFYIPAAGAMSFRNF